MAKLILLILLGFPLYLSAQGQVPQGLDDEFLETLRLKDNISRQSYDNEMAIDYGNVLIEFERPDQSEEYRHKTSDRLMVRMRYVAPEALKAYMESYVIGSEQYNNSMGPHRVDVRSFDVGALHRFGALSIQEALRVLRIENDGSTRVPNETFFGGMVRVDYRLAGWPFGNGSDRYGVHLRAEAERDRDFVAPLGTSLARQGLHEIDRVEVRGHVMASRWLFESRYENTTIDDDQTFYETQNTAALYWVPSGDSFSHNSWIFVGGLEHIKTDLNPKELLGVILSARALAPYQDDSERGGYELTLFLESQDAWRLTTKLEDGLSHLFGSQNPDENKWVGFQLFSEHLSGKWGTERGLGSELYIRLDY